MNKWTRLLLVGAVAGLTAYSATWFAYSQVLPPSGVTALSYLVVIRDYRSDGSLAEATTAQRALRADGSSADIRTFRISDGSSFEVRQIRDMQLRRNSIVQSRINAHTSIPISVKEAEASLAGPRKSCGLPGSSKRSEILGYEVLLSSFRAQDTGSGVRSPDVERWLAPSLGCIPLRVTWISNGRVVRSEEAQDIILGDPDPALFHIPDEYEEISPLEALRRIQQESGESIYNPSGFIEQFAEDSYWRRRANAAQ